MALVLLIGLAVAAKWWWWQVPPVIAITAPAGQFTKVEMWEEGISESGEPRSLANGRAEYPAEYGRHFVKVTLADQRACTFLYAHSDAGVRRKVTIHLEQLAKDRCRAQIWFNGFGQGSVEFDPALTADHPVILPPHH
ncbi:hypothetical protein llg_09280 [Luteolibacter sp. LG18]|nr:hypothetical protein llg_09280 [Luteolibacter sp. LG18]